MTASLDRIAEALGRRPTRVTPLSGGCIGDVALAHFPDGSRLVIKSAGPDGTLDVEGFMLRWLAANSQLPVPAVLHDDPSLLIMSYIDGDSRFSPDAQRHAADLLADLHSITASAPAPAFGFERDTLIGPLRQPNPWCGSWVEFFRDQRLLHMAAAAREAEQIDARLHDRIRKLADALPRLLDEPDAPALIHGDVWTTNVLARGGRIAAFIDPAIYFAHPEIELAFITLFSTFGEPFFRAYSARRPIRAGFFQTRRDIYNLYPLLVHTRLFGGGYAAQVSAILRNLNF